MSNKKEILLSIGLIVKNEEKNLRRCLDSLKPIMEAVPCQLIITDTGSEDKTAEIAGEYTKEVYSFKWCNDFAAARNFGLKKASGKWFMFIDADEWFGDCKDLIDFFVSEEYLKYKSACYQIRNFLRTDDLNDYHEQPILRLAEVKDSLTFEGKIHEYLVTEAPKKQLNSYISHLSYANDAGEEERQIKHERNLSILLEQYQQSPEDMRTAYLLAQQYKAGGMEEEFIPFVREKYELLSEQVGGEQGESPYLPYFLYYTAISYKKGDIGRGIEALEKTLRRHRKKQLWDLDLTAALADLYHNARIYDKAVEYCDKFFELYGKSLKGKLEGGESASLCAPGFTSKSYSLSIEILKIKGLMGQTLFQEAANELKKLDFLALPEGEQAEAVRLLVFCSACIGDYAAVAGRYIELLEAEKAANEQYVENKQLKSRLIMIEQLETLAVRDSDGMLGICAAFHDTCKSYETSEDRDDYMLLQAFRHSIFIEKSGIKDTLREYFDGMENAPQEEFSELLIWALILEIPVDHIIDRIDMDDIQLYTKKAFAMYGNLSGFLFKSFETKLGMLKNMSTKRIYLELCMLEIALLNVNSKLTDDMKIDLFNCYVAAGYMYLKRICNEDLLEDEEVEVLSRSNRFIYFAKQALSYVEDKDYKLGMEYYKKAVENYPVMAETVKLMLEEMTDPKEERHKRQAKQQSEFNFYAESIKNKILEINQAGMKDEAIGLLESYKKINGTDKNGIAELERALGLDN